MNEENERPLDPREAMRVLREQSVEARHGLSYPDHLLYTMWGGLYAVGYLPLALSRGPWAVADIPLGVALGVFFACIIAGVVASIVISARAARGVRGITAEQGRRYGFSWCLAFLGLFGFISRVGASGLRDDEVGVLINGVAMLLVGVLFMGGGLAWRDATQFRIGAVLCAVIAVALFVGLPAYYWILVVFAGLGLCAAGLVLTVRRRTEAAGPEK